MTSYFVTGIDTDIGKTYVTGLIGRYFLEKKKKVITAKIAQTGCTGISEDIELHRKIMGIELLEPDLKGLTCPYIFSYPASPHLAAELEHKTIDPRAMHASRSQLEKEYEIVISEGVGGIYVPLTREYTVLDYLKEAGLKVIVVTSGRLGSINHTLCTLEILIHRGITIQGLIYNLYPPEKKEISEDSQAIFANLYPHLPLVTVPGFSENDVPHVNFDPLFI